LARVLHFSPASITKAHRGRLHALFPQIPRSLLILGLFPSDRCVSAIAAGRNRLPSDRAASIASTTKPPPCPLTTARTAPAPKTSSAVDSGRSLPPESRSKTWRQQTPLGPLRTSQWKSAHGSDHKNPRWWLYARMESLSRNGFPSQTSKPRPGPYRELVLARASSGLELVLAWRSSYHFPHSCSWSRMVALIARLTVPSLPADDLRLSSRYTQASKIVS